VVVFSVLIKHDISYTLQGTNGISFWNFKTTWNQHWS